MQEFKFRAWDKENRTMHDVEFLGEEVLKISGGGWGNREEFMVMQYAGQKDCKHTEEYPEGQEIYGGDVVKSHYNTGREFVEVIAFNNGAFKLHYKTGGAGTRWSPLPYPPYITNLNTVYCEWIEVIGNIHENPELLGVE